MHTPDPALTVPTSVHMPVRASMHQQASSGSLSAYFTIGVTGCNSSAVHAKGQDCARPQWEKWDCPQFRCLAACLRRGQCIFAATFPYTNTVCFMAGRT
eukprot:1160775-Pelagomonas_calceolata.AAC.6